MSRPYQWWKLDATTPVFVRIDGNVPHTNNAITDDFRLRRTLPTLHTLYVWGCPIILATHIDRPKGRYKREHSTAIIANWLSYNGYTVTHIPCEPNEAISRYIKHITPEERTITVLENMRFFSGEKHDKESFAKTLAQTASYYINDAWGMAHRTDASVLYTPRQFPVERRSKGNLIHEEEEALSPLRDNPQQPFAIWLGGAKVASKIPIIEDFIDNKQASYIAIMPGIAGTFLHAQGYTIGASLVDTAYTEQARRILRKAKDSAITIDIPDDVYIVRKSWDNELIHTNVTDIPKDGIIIASGPKTVARYKKYARQATNIFLNGPMGDQEYFHTLTPFRTLLNAIEDCNAYRVVGGGDTVGILNILANNPFDFYSTGGGATLAYVSQANLPALTVLQHHS